MNYLQRPKLLKTSSTSSKIKNSTTSDLNYLNVSTYFIKAIREINFKCSACKFRHSPTLCPCAQIKLLHTLYTDPSTIPKLFCQSDTRHKMCRECSSIQLDDLPDLYLYWPLSATLACLVYRACRFIIEENQFGVIFQALLISRFCCSSR